MVEFLWDNLPAICVGAFGLQLVLLFVGIARDRRPAWPPDELERRRRTDRRERASRIEQRRAARHPFRTPDTDGEP